MLFMKKEVENRIIIDGTLKNKIFHVEKRWIRFLVIWNWAFYIRVPLEKLRVKP